MKTKLLLIALILSGLMQTISAQNGRVYDECNAGIKPTWAGNTKIVWGENSVWAYRNGDVYRYALDNTGTWAYMVYEVPAGAAVSKMIVDFYSPTGAKPTLAVKDIAGKEIKYVQGWDNGMPTEIQMGKNLYRYMLPKEIIPDAQFQGCVYLDANTDVEIMRVVTEYGTGYVKPDYNLNADFSRLEKFLAKAMAKEDLTIAVIGGSITAGANSEPMANFPNCYGARIKQYLETKYGITVNLINAGIGSTNSFFGDIRAEEHFLKFNPDLVVMEYSVNDSPDQQSLICYEGLMRKILKAPGHPALLVAMMCTQASIGQGTTQIPIAQHYNVPVINYSDIVKDEIILGQKTWSDYYAITTNPGGDGVHPNTAGHQKVADMFAEICEVLTPNISADIKTTLPVAMYSDMMENAFFVNEEDVIPIKIGTWIDGGTIWDFKTGKGWRSSEANSELIFDFIGDVAAVTYWKRPVEEGFGKAQVWVDDAQSIEIDGSDGNSITQCILSGLGNGSHK
ncbi:MAG: SGNH/GDSL hydrolase family protein, partial [Muribaculaceae bacterium]